MENTSKENKSTENMPNLDEIISQITSNGEFHDMMSQISGEVNKNSNSNNENIITESNEESCNDSELNNLDILTSLFTDESGNNICEILSGINNNLEKIANNLTTK